MIIGILAFQGDFSDHAQVLSSLDVGWREVRTLQDLHSVDRLIIPGGESTVISRFLRMEGLDKEIKLLAAKDFPVFGTCAGAIVMAKNITGGKGASALGLIDIDVDRNAYGTQLDSFEASIKVKGLKQKVPVSFIRAPIVTRVGKGVEVLAEHRGHPVLMRQGKVLAMTCHPEMRGSTEIHGMFLQM